MASLLDDEKGDSIRQLIAVKDAVRRTRTIYQVLDAEWFADLEAELAGGATPATVPSDPAGVFAALLDGPKDLLSRWDSRLTGLVSVPFKHAVVAAKLQQMRASLRSRTFQNHCFEANVLGDLACRSVLVDIEDARTRVDGVMAPCGRPVLLEATNTTQDLIPEFRDAFWIDPGREIQQVVVKAWKKAGDGRQIALASRSPAVLFLARTRRGADDESAAAAIEEVFRDPSLASLSGIVLSDTWKLLVTRWYPAPRCSAPLTPDEIAVLAGWYGRTE